VDKAEFARLKSWLGDQIENRRKLGGYNQDALSLLNMFEITLKMVDHLSAMESRLAKAERKLARTKK